MFSRLPLAAFLMSLLVLGGLLAYLWYDYQAEDGNQRDPLVVQSGAALRVPLDAILQAYEKETGQKVEARYGGSQTVLTNLQVTGQGDLYLPADESFITLAQEKNLLDEVLPIAEVQTVLLVHPKVTVDIQSFDDLINSKLKIAQTNPDAAAIGKLARAHLKANNLWSALEKRTTVFTANINEVGNAVKLGSVDAGLVWDAVAFNYPTLKVVRLPELDAISARIQVAVVRKSTRPTDALRLARFIAARNRGLEIFAKNGFTRLEQKADAYAHTPEITVYGGSMLRPAIDPLIDQFETREGVQVKRIYNGCGILVSQMKTGQHPDLYFACDIRFMAQVQALFEPAAVVSSNQLVIAVPRGNPRKLAKLVDLGKEKLRIGVGHEQQCALGAITKETFLQGGVYGQVIKNVVVQSPTGDFLVNQLRTGSLDAVVAYKSNTEPYDDIDAVPVTGFDCAFPEQPVAVNQTSQYPQLTRRMIDTLTTPSARMAFEKLGFGWKWKNK